MDVMKSGLQSLDDLKQEIENNKKSTQVDEKDAFDQLKAQKTIYRDKDGKVITESGMGDLVLSKKDKLKKMNQDRLKMWSKGIVQEQGREEDNMEELKTKNDGADYDNAVDRDYKQQNRFGDPLKEIKKHHLGKATDKDRNVLWSRKIFPP